MKRCTWSTPITLAVVALLADLCPHIVLANPIYTDVISPIVPGPYDVVPHVEQVPGKEFTDSFDQDYNPIPHAVSPLQLGVFDGLGGARNGHNITGFVPTNIVGRHVDAQAQVRDTLFDDVIANRVPLVVSVEGDQMLGSNVALAAERTGGAVQSFATSAQIVDHGHNGGVLRDIDSVDLWGIEGMTGTNFLSIDGDVAGTSIYSMNIIGPGGVQPYLSQLDIATAIGMPQLDTIIDVDALMVRDLGLDDGTASPFDGQFGPGDAVMFSVAPVSLGGQQVLDGGEIWVWEHGQPAHFLNHGGHVWNTAFSVREVYGTQLENIDALEAVSVPEPSSALLTLLLGGTLAIVRQRRRLT